jgi:hypothetical protein
MKMSMKALVEQNMHGISKEYYYIATVFLRETHIALY